jgi:hypothetical protein
MTAQRLVCGLGLVKLSSEEKSSDESSVDEAGGAAVGVVAQAVLRKERADREGRLEGLAVAVLTTLGDATERFRDTERRAGDALQTMTAEEGLSLQQAVEWCGSGRSYGVGGVSATPTHARPVRRQRR